LLIAAGSPELLILESVNVILLSIGVLEAVAVLSVIAILSRLADIIIVSSRYPAERIMRPLWTKALIIQYSIVGVSGH
jgi:hypothetical protein